MRHPSLFPNHTVVISEKSLGYGISPRFMITKHDLTLNVLSYNIVTFCRLEFRNQRLSARISAG